MSIINKLLSQSLDFSICGWSSMRTMDTLAHFFAPQEKYREQKNTKKNWGGLIVILTNSHERISKELSYLWGHAGHAGIRASTVLSNS
jgi:hypothetical protein